MTEETLMLFIKNLLANGSVDKSEASLSQLKQILSLQGENSGFIELIDKAIKGMPETKGAAQNDTFTEKELNIAVQRAEYRKRMEHEMERNGRC